MEKDMEFITYYRTMPGKDRGSQLRRLRAQVKQFKDRNDATQRKSFSEEVGPVAKEWPVLESALAACQKAELPLIIAEIGRLRQNPRLMKLLAESGVEFVCLDDQQVNSNTAGILAAFAEEQAEKRSIRTRAVMDRLKAEGVPLGASRDGTWTGSKKNIKLGPEAAARARQKKTANFYAEITEKVLGWRADGVTLGDCAEKLNNDGHTTQAGKPFTEVAVHRIIKRAEQRRERAVG